MNEHKAIYLDPLKQKQRIDELLAQLFRFLKAEMWLHDRKVIESTSWADFQCVKAFEYRRFSPHDTGVFICRQAELLTQQGECVPENSQVYRRAIQDTVIRACRSIDTT